MQLNTILQYKGQIELLSGLHIGSGDAEMKIGGIDSSVIKHPYTNAPYIPGSSIKGKMRSMLEWSVGSFNAKGSPVSWTEYQNEADPDKKQQIKYILQLFGVSGDANNDEIGREIGATRLSFWDCQMDQNWIKERDDNNQLMTESKSENSINRITGTADNPRFIERVPAGARFDFSLNVKLINDDQPDQLKPLIFSGLKLLEMDALGGSGSRGYGKIRFIHLTENGQPVQEQLDNTQVFAR